MDNVVSKSFWFEVGTLLFPVAGVVATECVVTDEADLLQAVHTTIQKAMPITRAKTHPTVTPITSPKSAVSTR